MIAIIDYGMGNLRSVEKALERVGATATVTSDPEAVGTADKVVLPGVGSFGDAVEELGRRNLIEPIIGHIKRGRVFLGLCLGMQLLFPKSEESPEVAGFSLFRGTVAKFALADNTLKIPHMGWNQVAFKRCPLFKGIPEGAHMYFVHSYYAAPDDDAIVAATTEYGVTFAAALWKDNVYAMQFHPEKSQRQGLAILKNFVNL
jgi:glutamine amidotransferase